MINNEVIKKKILDSAIHGKLIENDPNLLSLQLKKCKENDNLPSNWICCEIDDVLDSIPIKKYQISQTEIFGEGKYPVISQSQKLIEGYSNEEQKLLDLHHEYIVFGDHSKTVKYIDFPFIVGADGTKVFHSKSCFNKYIYYHMLHNSFFIKSSGYTRNYKYLKEYLYNIPPIEEQKRIVNKIDELFELIDKKERNDKEKEKLKIILKEKILDNAFNGTLTDSNNNTWKNVVFSEVIDVRDGTHDSPKYVEYSDYPLITSKNLTNKGLDFSNVNYLKEEDYNLINQRSYVDDGDVLFAMIGSIGNPVLVNKGRNFAIKNVALFKCKSEIYNKFLYYFLLHEKDMKDKTKGGVQKFVSLKILRNYPIKLPPLEEQKKIVEKIENLFELIEQL